MGTTYVNPNYVVRAWQDNGNREDVVNIVLFDGATLQVPGKLQDVAVSLSIGGS
jgi:hypothetical protein